MKFERPRPVEVDKAIKSGDKEKIVAFAKAGGKASAQKRVEKEIQAELSREMHEESMRQIAETRHDELLPEEE